jgi:hypothetical protein
VRISVVISWGFIGLIAFAYAESPINQTESGSLARGQTLIFPQKRRNGLRWNLRGCGVASAVPEQKWINTPPLLATAHASSGVGSRFPGLVVGCCDHCQERLILQSI